MRLPETPFEWLTAASFMSNVCSVVCNVLPNDKYLAAYPRLQRFYLTVINFLAAFALNVRHCLPSLNVPFPAIGITKDAEPAAPAEPPPAA